ncbi:epididymal protein 13 isoform X2 [Mesocricetus auratus]|uniref:Epididymal protein 13 isoform X2 n=1 Tax=Mesocricetus auratus TaxID=10036 RepID=A0ABM2WP84_MESAU|nr:epididymal protein 13 isoform X2 [Mesocricetus auratus]
MLGLMSRLSPDDRTEEEMKILKQILGLLSLQVLSEETNDCKEEVKSPPATTTARVFVKNSGWSFLRCAYMVITFLFVSYNKGDWCYCHYCSPDMNVRDDPCCSF